MEPQSGIVFAPLSESDREPVIDLFNYYIENSFAAYPELPVPYGFFDLFLGATKEYPSVVARDREGKLAGFGMLRSYNSMTAFARTAEISYFLRPDWTGRGLGTQILQQLETEGKARGIATILAGISSKNEGSIRFHKKNGFEECGLFRDVGRKKGVLFDTVWMQKFV